MLVGPRHAAAMNIRDPGLLSLALAALITIATAGSIGASGRDDRDTATVYVTNWGSNSVSRLELSADGNLTLREVVDAPPGSGNALGAAPSRDRRSLYVAQWGSGSLSNFQIKHGGRLVAIRTVLAAPPAPMNSAQVVLSPDGRHAFMTNFNNGAAGTLSIYEVDNRVRPTATIPSGGDGAAGVAISVDGRTLYVVHMTSGNIAAFRIAAGGTPTLLGSWPAGQGAFVVTLSPEGRRLWVANALSNDVSAFAVSADGRLTPDGPATAVAGDGPRGLVVAPDGGTIYVTLYAGGDGPGAVATFRVQRSGALEPLGEPILTGGNGAEAIALTANGRRLLVVISIRERRKAALPRFLSITPGASATDRARSTPVAPSPTLVVW